MATTLIEHFQLLARYNTLANERLYQACGQLEDAERRRIRPAFFQSIHGTLNHILVGDRIWLGRFTGNDIPTGGLDVLLYEDFTDLHQARIQDDAHIETFTANLTDAFLERSMTYHNSQGTRHKDPMSILLAHFFNHQTHHRGQVHDLLSQTTVAPPSLDLHRLLCPNPDGTPT